MRLEDVLFVSITSYYFCLFQSRDFFVCHADNVAAHKPDPAGLQQIMQTLHISPAHTLMVGDGVPDIEVAKAAGTRSVALLQGNTGEADLRRMQPDWMVATFAEFTTLFFEG